MPKPCRHVATPIALLIAITIAAVSGCTTSTATFTVDLKNDSPEPVTVWLTKDGGPDEEEWVSPEMIAAAGLKNPERLTGPVIPPGKTGSFGPITGKFEQGSRAILRVYAGTLSFEQMLATSEGPLRVDVPLEQGTSRLRVNPKPPLAVEPR